MSSRALPSPATALNGGPAGRTSFSKPALVALFTAGYLAAYLLPTVVGRVADSLALSPTQAGLVGSALLLSSATAGLTLATRVERIGARRAARSGLLLAAVGYGTAALASTVPLVVAGAMIGGFGSGTATAVAATGIAAQKDPHRASTLGLLSVSALAGALYLTIPRISPSGHILPFAALALTALSVWPVTRHLAGPATPDNCAAPAPKSPLPFARSGAVLAAVIVCWSMAQNSLWGVSSRIGTEQAGLSEVAVGSVFAVALGAGLLGVIGAGALGARIGRALPIGAGTAAIACCIALSARAEGLATFAGGEIAWNTLYPVVLSYLLGLAASLDPRGRWAVLVGSASSLGTACGPLVGSSLSQSVGFPVMGATLAVLLLLLAVPLTAVALHTGGRPLFAGAARRRSGAPVGAMVPPSGLPEQPVVEIEVPAAMEEAQPDPVQAGFTQVQPAQSAPVTRPASFSGRGSGGCPPGERSTTAGPRSAGAQSSNSYASTSAM
ncbi:sugar MFS transporter [Streptomyces sp. VRA16 Mangrove soil]|uniref:MFS transporter n=1 Tax=Streptomyces sp. VRA16 Mangrove soil TaxID=2817434 RepID=UPI001A9F943A|nr:MFS transporter [Streptomyces sp. VRA16 Mangrove soil]MBO1336964.1 MFS transporter [Streptomyces sp. VRA16 Mangrove soil]